MNSKTPMTLDVQSASEFKNIDGAAMDRRLQKRFWTLRRTLWIGAGAILTSGAVYAYVFGDFSAKLNVERDKITIADVTQGPFQEFIPLRGTVMPIRTIYLDAVEGGRVEEIFVEEGNLVEQNQPLLKLSNPDLELSVMNQEAQLIDQLHDIQNIRLQLDQQAIEQQEQLMTIEHSLQQARRESDVNQAMYEKFQFKGVSRTEYEQSMENTKYWVNRQSIMHQILRQDSLYRVGELEQLEASRKHLEMNLSAVKRNLDNLLVKAPISGQLSLLDAEIGELKSRGQRLGQVDNLSAFMIRADIDEYYIARITPGLSGSFQVAGGETTYLLRTTKVYPEVREGQFQVDMEFVQGTPDGIRRGQTLQIRLTLGDPINAVLIPRGSFFQTTGGNWIFVVDPSTNMASRRTIQLGRQSPDYFEVIDGLAPGEQVVVSGYENYEEIEKLVF